MRTRSSHHWEDTYVQVVRVPDVPERGPGLLLRRGIDVELLADAPVLGPGRLHVAGVCHLTRSVEPVSWHCFRPKKSSLITGVQHRTGSLHFLLAESLDGTKKSPNTED